MTFSTHPGMLRVLLALVATTAVLFGLPTLPALAHAQLLRSNPTDGATLAAPPTQVEFVYNEDINPAFAQVVVRDSAGQPIQLQAPQVAGPVVRVPLPASINPGRITAAYRVTSKDGHPIAGQITFTITGGASSAQSSSATVPSASAAAPAGAVPTSTSDSGMAPMYLLTGLGALGLVTLGAVVLWWERKRVNP